MTFNPVFHFIVLFAVVVSALAIDAVTMVARSQDDVQFSLPVRIIEGPPPTAWEISGSEAIADREALNLKAQQSVARSTEYIVWLSVGQFLLATAGTAFLLYSLKLNRVSVSQAIEANNNTRNAIENEHRNTQRAIRAYLGVVRVDIVTHFGELRELSDGEASETSIRIEYKNFGQTPATDVLLFSDFYVLQTEGVRLESDWFAKEGQDEMRVATRNRNAFSRLVLNGSQNHQTDVPIREMQMRRALRDGKAGIYDVYVFGRINYVDCFGENWRLKFCFLKEKRTDSFIPYEHHNTLELSPHPYPNNV